MQFSAGSAVSARTLSASTLLAPLAFFLLLLSGCSRQTSSNDPNAGLGKNVQIYRVKGTVVGSDPAAGQVTVNSEPIPGFMKAMVMPYPLAQPNIASELHPGDRISARLRVGDTKSLLDQIVVTAQEKPDYKPVILYNVPTEGQAVPDFRFLNQDGKTINVAAFRGKALLVTFIYTRCPLPDFCIRMSRNFAEIAHALAADPRLDRKTHLLSISFDPGYDTPKVLRSYGAAYTGKSSNEAFAHWDFAAPPQGELEKVDEFFDVGVTPADNQTLTHSLSTVLIAPDGKIARWYPTNDWKPADVLNDIKQVVSRSKDLSPHEVFQKNPQSSSRSLSQPPQR